MFRRDPVPDAGAALTRQLPSSAPPFRAARRGLTPAQSLLLGFTALTLAGAWLLTLPYASAQGTRQQFVDAFFTATSAVTTTGLIVVDTGSYYSTFGQAVLLVLFQVGGLGYMAVIAALATVVGSPLSLRAGLTLQESLAGTRYGELKDFIKSVFLFTVLFEGIGALGLGLVWLRDFPVGQAFYQGLFHAVSAFCTAGFSLFADSFIRYRSSVIVNVLIAVVTFAGGIGFFVLRDLRHFGGRLLARGRPRRLSVHTKLTLVVALTLLVAGSALLFVAERQPPLGPKDRVLNATFQAFSASTTTGFNSVDVAAMTETSLFAMILLMFIGTGPGGTGGGIKVTTFGVVLAAVIALLRGSADAVAFRRRLAGDTVRRALTIGLVSTAWVVAATLFLTSTERASFMAILFEVTSALGTVGLSMGITAKLTTIGKVIISLTMLAGRLGPLAVGFALLGRPRRTLFRYTEAEVFVG